VIFSVIICPRCSYGAAKAEFSDNEDRCPRCDKRVLVPDAPAEEYTTLAYRVKETLATITAIIIFFVAVPILIYGLLLFLAQNGWLSSRSTFLSTSFVLYVALMCVVAAYGSRRCQRRIFTRESSD